MNKPLAIELFCGTFGWSQGWLARGGRVVGFDIEHLPHHGPVPCGASLVLQDVRTIHGRQFKDAALILASPPCQFFSYTAMPWSKAKTLATEVRADPAQHADRLSLFHACFRIQREASEAAGRHIPMVVENVRGAIPWVGRSAWHFGSYHLWGDVPALMPIPHRAHKVPGFRFDGSGGSFQTASVEGVKAGGGASWYPPSDPRHQPGLDFTRLAAANQNPVAAATAALSEMDPDAGRKGYAARLGESTISRRHGSQSSARKAASALIARIPERLSDWIAEVYFPRAARSADGEATTTTEHP